MTNSKKGTGEVTAPPVQSGENAGSASPSIVPETPSFEKCATRSNWRVPRTTVIDLAVNSLRHEWSTSIRATCEQFVRWHYAGKSPQHALGQLVRDVRVAYWERHGGQSQRSEEVNQMMCALRAEGWVLIGDQERGFLWRHRATGALPNPSGGTWRSIEAATIAVHCSTTREVLLTSGGDREQD